MWIRVAIVGAVLVGGCAVERDLGADRFTCERGGPCPSDSGVIDAGPGLDSGTRDGGATRDGGVAAPMCDPMFGPVDACGGDVVGNWDLVAVCGSGFFESVLQDYCPGATIQRSDAVGQGRVSFALNMVYDVSVALQLDADFRWPSLCRAMMSCPNVAMYLGTILGGDVTCIEGDGMRCDCTYFGAFPGSQDGDYSTLGNILTVETGPASDVDAPYCVDQNRLTYSLNGTTFVTERR